MLINKPKVAKKGNYVFITCNKYLVSNYFLVNITIYGTFTLHKIPYKDKIITMKRKILNALEDWKGQHKRKPLLLRGARQVGKTWVLKEFGNQSFPRKLYYNFEQDQQLSSLFDKDLSPERIIEELRLYSDSAIDIDKDLIIFDEIHLCPRALTALKYFNELMPQLAICAAGSLIGICLSDSSFPVGKVTFLEMYPMTFEEFLLAMGQSSLLEYFNSPDLLTNLPQVAHEKLWDHWKHYLIVGGLPEVVDIYSSVHENRYQAIKAAREVQINLIKTYMADIAKHAGKVNAMHIERLWQNIPSQLARLQDGSVSKFRFKDAVPGIRGYERLASPLGWLEKAGLCLRTSIIEKPGIPLSGFAREPYFKQYFFDTGMLNTVINIEPQIILKYEYGTYKGYEAENFVAQELSAATSGRLYCWQGRTSEIEFLIETTQGILPCEVKSGWVTRSKSLNVYQERYKPEKSIILSAKSPTIKGQRVYLPIYAASRLYDILSP